MLPIKELQEGDHVRVYMTAFEPVLIAEGRTYAQGTPGFLYIGDPPVAIDRTNDDLIFDYADPIMEEEL